MHVPPPTGTHWDDRVDVDLKMYTDLTRVLQQVLPLLRRKAALLLQRLQVRKLAVLAERQDQEVVELLCLRGPLALDDACTRPRRLSDVVSVLLLLRASIETRIGGVVLE